MNRQAERKTAERIANKGRSMIDEVKTKEIRTPTGDKARKIAKSKAIVMVSDDAHHWRMLMPEEVPDWLKDPDVMGDMMAGEVVSNMNEDCYYRVQLIS